MGLALLVCKVLSSVQLDPRSSISRRTLEAFPQEIDRERKKYRASEHAQRRSKRGALVDRGANGGIIGDDAHVIYTHPNQEVDVTGIDNHEINALRVVDASAKIQTQRGEAIGIFRQYAYYGKGRTIHSSGQIEWYKGNRVKERSAKVGGSQYIRTLDGYVIPIDIVNGLAYISMVPNTQKEFVDLPHVVFTGSEEWEPKVLDHKLSDNPNWFDEVKDDTLDSYLKESPFDAYGNYKYRYPGTKPRSRTRKGEVHNSETASLPSLTPDTSYCVDNDDDDDSSIDSTDSLRHIHLTETHGRRLDFRECFHMASNRNQVYVCQEHDVCKPEHEEKTKILLLRPLLHPSTSLLFSIRSEVHLVLPPA